MVGKTALVARLQILLGTQRIHLPDSHLMEQLVTELRVFQSRVSPRAGNVSYEAAPGHHDDLVMAAALAVWRGPTARRGRLVQYA